MQSEVEFYAQQDQEHFEIHRRAYMQKFPPPEMPEIEPESKWIFWALMAIMIAGLNVSAAHTIPFFIESVPSYKLFWLIDVKHITGLSAFVMVELAIVILSYSITRRRFLYDREKKATPGKVGAYFRAALILVLLIAVGVNIYSTYQGGVKSETVDLADVRLPTAKVDVIQEKPDIAKSILLILSGLAAPVLVYIVGDALGFMVVEERAEKAKRIRDHAEEKRQYNLQMIEDYNRKKGKGIYKLRPLEVAEPVRNMLSAGQADGQATGQGYTKRTNAREVVWQFLVQNPEMASGNVREIAKRLDVGKSTVSDVQREFKDKGGHQ